MANKQRNYSSEFKAKVVLEVLSGNGFSVLPGHVLHTVAHRMYNAKLSLRFRVDRFNRL